MVSGHTFLKTIHAPCNATSLREMHEIANQRGNWQACSPRGFTSLSAVYLRTSTSTECQREPSEKNRIGYFVPEPNKNKK